ncbi:hypothetical protein RRG08_050904 [Elysia crispata]|uniref:BHLH domain-containing protein n=1 Tax=Elysia crispata TaxID=231223 RepID=A0AAE0ZSQ7_9GAST|nr:hypothetical protein RRG08_050904 [Elysia crispata]
MCRIITGCPVLQVQILKETRAYICSLKRQLDQKNSSHAAREKARLLIRYKMAACRRGPGVRGLAGDTHDEDVTRSKGTRTRVVKCKESR